MSEKIPAAGTRPKPQPPSAENQAVGRAMKAAREKKGSIDKVVAQLADVGLKEGFGRATLGAWEVGRNLPNAVVLRRLSEFYGTSADELIGLAPSRSARAAEMSKQFDALPAPEQERGWRIWQAFVSGVPGTGDLQLSAEEQDRVRRNHVDTDSAPSQARRGKTAS